MGKWRRMGPPHTCLTIAATSIIRLYLPPVFLMGGRLMKSVVVWMRSRGRWLAYSSVLFLGLLMLGAVAARPRATEAAGASFRGYLPVQVKQVPDTSCEGIPHEHYSVIPVDPVMGPPDAPADQHPDMNLALRGYVENPTAHRGLVDYGGDTDAHAPQLIELFGDRRAPTFRRVYRVYEWDGEWPGVYGVIPIADPEVTLAGLAAQPGELIHLPGRGPDIYQGRYLALVLYAAPDRITLKYTRDDNVVWGYTIHLEGICVEPRLLALYEQSVAGGRTHLPGIERDQAIGRAMSDELGVVIRDNGWFMDPRSRKDWWQALMVAPMEVPQIDAMESEWFIERQRLLEERVDINDGQ